MLDEISDLLVVQVQSALSSEGSNGFSRFFKLNQFGSSGGRQILPLDSR